MQIYAEAKSKTSKMANKFTWFADTVVLPRRYSICGEAKLRRSREQCKRVKIFCKTDKIAYICIRISSGQGEIPDRR